MLCVAISAESPVSRTRFHQRPEHLIRCRRVQVPGRLIRQQQLGRIRQGPTKRHPLLFPPGKLRRPMPRPRGNPHARQQIPRPHLGRTGRNTIGQLRQHNVFQGRKLWQQVMELIDEPHIRPPRRGSVPVGKAGHVLTTMPHLPCIRRIQKPRDVQQALTFPPRSGPPKPPPRPAPPSASRRAAPPPRMVCPGYRPSRSRPASAHHSYRNASTGFIRAARRAGISVMTNDKNSESPTADSTSFTCNFAGSA